MIDTLALAVFAALPAVILAAALALFVKSASPFEKIALGLTLLHILVLITYPVIFSIANSSQVGTDTSAATGKGEVMAVLINESIYVLLFVIGFGIARRRSIGAGQTRIQPVIPPRVDRLFANTMIGLAWLFYVIPAVASPLSGGSILVFDADRGGILNTAIGWLGALFYIPALVVCSMRVSRPKAFSRDKAWFFLALMPLIGLLLIGITLGVRGRVTWIASLLIAGAYYYRNGRVVVIGVGLVAIYFPFMAFFGSAYRPIFQTAVYNQASRVDLASSALLEGREYARGSNINDLIYNGFLSLAQRAMGPYNSVFLYQYTVTSGHAGYKPIVGSLQFPIPRILLPGKLFPGSLSSDERDAAMYLVMEKGHGFTGYMGPFLSSAHAYWEGGWPWLILSGLGLGLFWGALCRFSASLGGILGLTVLMSFMGSLLIDGLFTAIAPAYAIILQMWKVLLPAYMLKFMFAVKPAMPWGSEPRRRWMLKQ